MDGWSRVKYSVKALRMRSIPRPTVWVTGFRSSSPLNASRGTLLFSSSLLISTTSSPTSFLSWATFLTIKFASCSVSPPLNKVPVPGANSGSIESISNEIWKFPFPYLSKWFIAWFKTSPTPKLLTWSIVKHFIWCFFKLTHSSSSMSRIAM